MCDCVSGLKTFFSNLYFWIFFSCGKSELLMELYKKEVAIFCTTCLICKSEGDCRIFEKYYHPKRFKGSLTSSGPLQRVDRLAGGMEVLVAVNSGYQRHRRLVS